MSKDPVIRTATFNPRVCNYWLWSPVLVFCLTVVLIPLILIWVPLALIFVRHYLARISCVLTSRNLLVKKGLLVRVEKTIPLEKITDLGLVQGPIMRYFGVHQLTVETAGQSGQGALVSLTGIEDVEAFREAVLEQRDKRQEVTAEAEAKPDSASGTGPDAVLTDIHNTLLRIEEALKTGQDTKS
jgi:putative membrane protein